MDYDDFNPSMPFYWKPKWTVSFDPEIELGLFGDIPVMKMPFELERTIGV
jgi:hypothetical protein